MKKFGLGVITGVVATVASAAAGLFAFHKTVVEPEEQREEKFTETEKKAARKMGASHTPRF